MGYLIAIVVLFALMWFLLIRPQRRRQLAQQALLSKLAPGDEIVTAGGLYGHVQEVRDEDLTVEIAPGTSVRLDRRAVASRVPRDGANDALPAKGPKQVSSGES